MRTFRHAVSLDERRAKFKANLWNRPNATEAKLGVTGQKATVGHNTLNGHPKHKQPTLAAMEMQFNAMESKDPGHDERPTDIEEVRTYLYHPCTRKTLRHSINN